MTGDVTPVIDKNYLISLHGQLSVFHTLLSQRTIPHSWDAPGCAIVTELMEFIEKLDGEQSV